MFEKASAQVLQELVSDVPHVTGASPCTKHSSAINAINAAWFSLDNYQACTQKHVYFPWPGTPKAFIIYCHVLR